MQYKLKINNKFGGLLSGGLLIGISQNFKAYTYSPRWLVPRNLDEAYTGVCVASGAQYKKNGLCILA